jgi:hypothetical protein
MIHEETTLGSFVTKAHLKKTFFNEGLSLLLTELTDEKLGEARLYIKKVENVTENVGEEEEGEISTGNATNGKVRYIELDRGMRLREALEGCIIAEYPTIYVEVK